MRIIKQGTAPCDVLYTATCRICKTEVEFKRSEAKYHSDQRDGDFVSVDCPVCAAKITKAIRS